MPRSLATNWYVDCGKENQFQPNNGFSSLQNHLTLNFTPTESQSQAKFQNRCLLFAIPLITTASFVLVCVIFFQLFFKRFDLWLTMVAAYSATQECTAWHTTLPFGDREDNSVKLNHIELKPWIQVVYPEILNSGHSYEFNNFNPNARQIYWNPYPLSTLLSFNVDVRTESHALI